MEVFHQPTQTPRSWFFKPRNCLAGFDRIDSSPRKELRGGRKNDPSSTRQRSIGMAVWARRTKQVGFTRLTFQIWGGSNSKGIYAVRRPWPAKRGNQLQFWANQLTNLSATAIPKRRQVPLRRPPALSRRRCPEASTLYYGLTDGGHESARIGPKSRCRVAGTVRSVYYVFMQAIRAGWLVHYKPIISRPKPV